MSAPAQPTVYSIDIEKHDGSIETLRFIPEPPHDGNTYRLTYNENYGFV